MTSDEFCSYCMDSETICFLHYDPMDAFDVFPYSNDTTDIDSGSLSPNMGNDISYDDLLVPSEYDQIITMLCDMILTLENSMNEIKRMDNDGFAASMFGDTFIMLGFEIAMIRTIATKKKSISVENLEKNLDGIESAMYYVP